MITMLVLCMSLFCVHATVHTAAPAPKQKQDPKEKVRVEETLSFAQTDARTPLEKLYAEKYSKRDHEQLRQVRDSFLPIEPTSSQELSRLSGIIRTVWRPNGTQLVALNEGRAYWNGKKYFKPKYAYICDVKTNVSKPLVQNDPDDAEKDYKWSSFNVFKNQSDTIDAVALNQEGTMLATIGERHVNYAASYTNDYGQRTYPEDSHSASIIARFWDASTGEDISSLKQLIFNTFLYAYTIDDLYYKKDTVHSLIWNPIDSNIFALLGNGEDRRYPSLNTNVAGIVNTKKNSLTQVPFKETTTCAAWSGNGTKLAVGTEKDAYIWDAVTQKLIYTGQLLSKQSVVALNHDGTQLATGLGNTVCVWDTTTGKLRFKLSDNDPIQSIVWSPKHHDLVQTSIDWHPENTDLVQLSIAPNPQFNRLMVTSGNKVTMVDGNGNPAFQHPVNSMQSPGAVFNHEGTRIATINGNNAYVYDAYTGAALFVLPHHGPVTSLDWNQHDQLATCAQGKMQLWDTNIYNDFIAGKLTKEESVLLRANELKQFRENVPLYIAYPLVSFARHLKVPIAELARGLSTLGADVRKKFLARNNISTTRKTVNVDGTQEDYIDCYKAFDTALSVLHQTEGITQVRDKDAITKALGEYIVEADSNVNTIDIYHDELKFRASIQLHPRFRQETSQSLCAAIDAHDLAEVKKHLNPVSAHDRFATNNNRTPLMQAVLSCNPAKRQHNEIFTFILNYQGEFMADSSATIPEVRASDLAATDDDNKTALMIAIEKNCLYCALQIAQKMDSNPAFHNAFATLREKDNVLESAYEMAHAVNEQNQDNPNYHALMNLLEKHKRSKYLLVPTKAHADQPKKLSALERLYKQKFPQGHAQEWKAISEPFVVKPIRIDAPGAVQKMLLVNNGKTLVTLSNYTVQLLDWDEKKFQTFNDATWHKKWTEDRMDMLYANGKNTYRFSKVAGIACDPTGTKLAVLLEYDWFYADDLLPCQRNGSRFTIKMYEANSMKSLDHSFKDEDIRGAGGIWDRDCYTINWPSGSAYPQFVKAKKQAMFTVDASYPITWDYKPMIHRHHIYDAATNRAVYHLQDSESQNIVAWNQDGTKLATKSRDINTINLWDLKKYNQFLKGDVPPEQAMLVCALAEQSEHFRKTYPLYDVPCALKDCARRIHKLGITTATLANVLLTLDPAIRTALMKYYNISSKRLLAHDDPEQKAYREDTKRAAQGDATLPQDPQYDYLQACQAVSAARATIIPREYDAQRAAEITDVLEEYMVEESPQLHIPNSVDDAIERTRVLQDPQYRIETTKNLFAAIARRDLKAFNEHLNPVSVGDVHSAMKNRTPFMYALVCYDRNNQTSRTMVERLLQYAESLVLNKSAQETRTSDLAATDADGNLPVMLVKNMEDLDLVLTILHKMKEDPLLHAALKRIKEDPRYKALVEISKVLEEERRLSASV